MFLVSSVGNRGSTRVTNPVGATTPSAATSKVSTSSKITSFTFVHDLNVQLVFSFDVSR
jgi:hypothetical protein